MADERVAGREGAEYGMDIEPLPDYVRNGIVRIDTDTGPGYLITDRAREWLMRGDNCANREFNAMLLAVLAARKG